MIDFGLLCPAPQRAHLGGGRLELPLPLRVVIEHDAQALYASVARVIGGWPRPPARIDAIASVRTQGELRLGLERGLPAQGFDLRVRTDGILLEGADERGLAYGLECLGQILRQLAHDPQAVALELPLLEVSDWPDFPVRGYVLDVSRTRVPSMTRLRALVRTLAALRINQLQLYTEHTFAYLGHEEVWRNASPITPGEILELDALCRAHGIELVPNQQSFGHLHRWLIHERYRPLAEVPEGVEHAFSRQREPFALCATDPASLAFLGELWDQLLPNFSSASFNVGCDETFDLGLGRSKALCDRHGKGRVYLDFLKALEKRVRARGRRMQFWGDIVLQHPGLLAELPREALALEWGYEEDHPFAHNLDAFRKSGLEFQVCPGTSSWQSFAGRTHNMLANLESAAAEGKRTCASGYLVTDWGDRGHLQPPVVSWPGIVAGAALSWNASSAGAVRARLDELLDAHIFGHEAAGLGKLALELGDVYRTTRARSTNGSPLFFLVAFADQKFPHERVQNLTREGLLEALESIMLLRVRLEGRPAAPRGAADELGWVAAMLAFACRLGVTRLAAPEGTPLEMLPQAERRRLARELEELVGTQRTLWLESSRPGGLEESIGWLTRPLALLAT
ncbi:MAG: family 20 glycosylhydrolase [Planctomycetes bacterium]|nr:family 20 glycosylhydrolase [Planctomycetota bacterium]